MNKNLLTLAFLLTSSYCCFGQKIDASFCNANSFKVKIFKAGDSLVAPCDSLFLMNKSTFKVYKNLYDNRSNTNTAPLIKAFAASTALYEQRIKEQNQEYDSLMAQFKSLSEESGRFVQTGNTMITSINVSLDKTNESLKNANVTIDSLNKTLKKERWNALGKKAMAAGGGLAIGLLIGLLVGR